jgi:hypothetical protein
MQLNRPTISRDTRRLLAIVLISLVTLWVFARIRFPDRAAMPNPMPPMLAQLAPPEGSALDDIAASMSRIQSRVDSSVLAVAIERRMPGSVAASRTSIPAFRFRDDFALTMVPPAAAASDPERATVIGTEEVRRDPASSLSVVRAPGAVSVLSTWSPRRLDASRFLVAAAAAQERTALRPVFIGPLHEIASPIWPGRIWGMPPGTALEAGALVFAIDGAFAGVTVDHNRQLALVPATTVLAVAERLTRESATPPGRLGIEVAPLTPAIAAATGAQTGVVVAWVDAQGPAAGQLQVTDIIEVADGVALNTAEHWRARAARLSSGDAISLRVRRSGAAREVNLTAAAAAAAPEPRPLGVTWRTIAGAGAAIVAVAPGSAAAAAGLLAGDVVTVVAGTPAPTASQAARAFAAAAANKPIVIALTRSGSHHVLALERTW